MSMLLRRDSRRCGVIGSARPNPSLNADVPHAGLRRRSGPPVSLFR